MRGIGFTVVRIPQPKSRWFSAYSSWTIRTYTNSTFANNRALVPTYGEATDAVALSIYDTSLPAAVQEVGIDSDYIIDYGGAMHCITMEKHP